ncbi:hypothetical protein [Kitasatospora sp. NPDC047058]|uniref:zinc finger domain-containing protein n=1 Tax=Kitasatospora sp. NPDC047058 TaxID=3155620 RepID=UPI00340BEABE
MDPIEAGTLLAHAAAFDNRKPSAAANRAWADALRDIPLDQDALDAVTRYYGQAAPDTAGISPGRWIQPHHVTALRRQIRAERTPDTDSVIYPAGRIETGAEFVERRRQQLTAIADGRIEPEINRQLKGGPHPSLDSVLNGIGQMPAHLREELAARGVTTRRGRFPEMSAPCPKCGAAVGRPCRRPSGTELRDDTHGSRRDAYQAQANARRSA